MQRQPRLLWVLAGADLQAGGRWQVAGHGHGEQAQKSKGRLWRLAGCCWLLRARTVATFTLASPPTHPPARPPTHPPTLDRMIMAGVWSW